MVDEKITALIKRYKGALIGVIVGIILVALLFTIGFWKTLLALLIIFICAFLGNWVAKSGTDGIIRLVDKIFK